jgi:putative resolvase
VAVVGHRDWLAGFEVEHLEAAVAAQGRWFLVADPGETTDVLVRDVIEVVTRRCARLRGCRGARDREMGVLTDAQHESGRTA